MHASEHVRGGNPSYTSMARDVMPLNVYIGWTGESALAYEVCRASLLATASIPVNVIPLRHWELRNRGMYWRPYRVSGIGQRIDGIDAGTFSTDFSFTRFLVPALEGYADRWAIYCDNDMLWLEDVAYLLTEVEGDGSAVACVQHSGPAPGYGKPKITGSTQTDYPRKNWSSLMVMNPARCSILSPEHVSTQTGAYLHQFRWLNDRDIGALSPQW